MADHETDPRTAALRRVFLHQDGLAVATALSGLAATGTLDRLLSSARPRLAAVLADPVTGPVSAACVRALQSAGWLELSGSWHGPATQLCLTMPPPLAEQYLAVHDAASRALCGVDWADDGAVGSAIATTLPVLHTALTNAGAVDGLSPSQRDMACRHLEGVVATPVVPRLPAVDDEAAREVLTALGLVPGTPLGDAARRGFPLYGLAGSYARTMFALPTRMAEGTGLRPGVVADEVDRRLNVLASGAAHRTYFRAAGGLIRQVFDEAPPAGRPKAIVDVGCGDGSWLRSVFAALSAAAPPDRGFDRQPLTLVGVDVDQRALAVAAEHLRGLPAVLIQGDIGAPEALHADIAARTGLAPDDLLHIRAFVDHNRTIADADTPGTAPPCDDSVDIGLSDTGRLLSTVDIHADWVRHYRSWRPWTGRHGIVVIEGHTVLPAATTGGQGTSHALAFEFYHHLSGQSPVRWQTFRAAAEQAGMCPGTGHQVFPRSRPTTTSVQRFVSRSGR
jgi:hypothetical protein